MTRRRCSIAIWLLGVLAATAAAQTAAPPAPPHPDEPVERDTRASPAVAPTHPVPSDPAAEVDQLIAQLGSDRWPLRQAAHERLVVLGAAAEEQLRRAARDSGDAEVRTRCETVLAEIAEARLIGPTLITMRLANAAPRDAFAELARRAGIELAPQHASVWNLARQHRVTIEADAVPFWEVVRRLTEQCGLDVDAPSPGSLAGLCVMMPPAGKRPAAAPVSISGPFRVRATRITRTLSVDLATGNAAAGDFTVALAIAAEPKMRISSMGLYPRVELAEDEQGTSLLPPGAGPNAPVRGVVGRLIEPSSRAGNAVWSCTVRLRYPADGAGRRIARLRGATSCLVVIRSETLEIPDIADATNVSRQIEGGGGRAGAAGAAGVSEITVKSCRKVGEFYELKLELVGDQPGPQMIIRAARRTGGGEGIRIVDQNDREMNAVTMNSSSSGQRTEMTLRVTAPAGATPSKLLWQVPTDVRELEVPFEFTDLPLP